MTKSRTERGQTRDHTSLPADGEPRQGCLAACAPPHGRRGLCRAGPSGSSPPFLALLHVRQTVGPLQAVAMSSELGPSQATVMGQEGRDAEPAVRRAGPGGPLSCLCAAWGVGGGALVTMGFRRLRQKPRGPLRAQLCPSGPVPCRRGLYPLHTVPQPHPDPPWPSPDGPRSQPGSEHPPWAWPRGPPGCGLGHGRRAIKQCGCVGHKPGLLSRNSSNEVYGV